MGLFTTSGTQSFGQGSTSNYKRNEQYQMDVLPPFAFRVLKELEGLQTAKSKEEWAKMITADNAKFEHYRKAFMAIQDAAKDGMPLETHQKNMLIASTVAMKDGHGIWMNKKMNSEEMQAKLKATISTLD